MTAAAIALTGLTSKRGKFQLGPLDMTAPRGSVIAFIGPNGAGKTTTLDLIMGLGRPDSGVIEVLGLTQPADEVAIKARVAYVNPDLNFMIWGTVGRALDFVSAFHPDWDEHRCDRLLAEFRLKRTDKVMTLSFGARIKLSLVMALSRDADILLLDEPTVGLDVAARHKLFSELLEFMKREGKTVVISSHQLTDLERLADQVAIIDGGRLLTMGRMDELVERYLRIDARLPEGRLPPVGLAGIKLIARQGDCTGFLVDTQVAGREALEAAGLVIVSQTPLTLEDLFLALVGGS